MLIPGMLVKTLYPFCFNVGVLWLKGSECFQRDSTVVERYNVFSFFNVPVWWLSHRDIVSHSAHVSFQHSICTFHVLLVQNSLSLYFTFHCVNLCMCHYTRMTYGLWSITDCFLKRTTSFPQAGGWNAFQFSVLNDFLVFTPHLTGLMFLSAVAVFSYRCLWAC